MSAERCPRCGGIEGPDGTLLHGLVHRRHEAGGGGVNLPCPNAPATQTAADEREEAERFRKEYLGEWVRGPRDHIVWDAAERVRASGRSNVAAVIHATLDAVEAAGCRLTTPATVQSVEAEPITGTQLVERERARQIAKGYTTERDSMENTPGQMRQAAIAFETGSLSAWPWFPSLFHPRGALWNLTRAGAMYLAAEQMSAMTAHVDPAAAYERMLAADGRGRIESQIDRLLWEVGELHATAPATPADTDATVDGVS